MARELRRDDDSIKIFVEIEAREKKADCRIGIRTSIIGRLLAINNRLRLSIGREREREIYSNYIKQNILVDTLLIIEDAHRDPLDLLIEIHLLIECISDTFHI